MTEFHAALLETALEHIDKAMEVSVISIQSNHLSISPDLYYRKTAENKRFEPFRIMYTIFSNTPVWEYLNYGTGVFNPEHAGSGAGGRIVPKKAKALHFKNAQLASALGFKSEDVFLRSVKGIKPRYYFERTFDTERFSEAFQKF